MPGLGLVDLGGSGLPEALVGRVSDELELFAARIHEGLLAAAVAVGLEVFGQCSRRTSPRWPVRKADTIRA